MIDCQYCNKPAELTTGETLYPSRAEFKSRKFWACMACEAWVGVHPNTIDFQPMGTLANSDLRKARQRAHEAFDPVWRGPTKKLIPKQDFKRMRTKGYTWLAEKMGIDIDKCHIGIFDLAQCFQVINLCKDQT